MDFDIPTNIKAYLDVLDDFIAKEIQPLQQQDDNNRFFDHRREHARTDWDNDGQPREEWEELLREMRRRADASRPFALWLAERIWRPRWQQFGDGHYSRASGGQRAWLA